MKPFQTLPRINSRLTNGKPKHGATLIVAICLASISMVDIARAEFWFEDFTDGSITDSGIDWLFTRDHSIETDGLLLSTDNTNSTGAGPDWPADRQGWSIRTQGRILQDHGFFGLASMPTPGVDIGQGAYNFITANGNAALGSLGFGISDSVATDLSPFEEDAIVQLETLDGVMRMWAWRYGEQPTEDIAPLIEEEFELLDAAPAIWARSNDGPSSALFRWMAISTEHMPINMPVPLSNLIGDFSGEGDLDVADIDLLATAIQAGKTDQQFDLNRNGTVDREDHAYWVRDIKHTWMGDANLDGQFNSGDFVQVFQSGKYETDQIASWSDGDWNGDARFNSVDFVVAFQDGGYELGPRASVAAVPEPSAAILLTLGLLGIGRIRKR